MLIACLLKQGRSCQWKARPSRRAFFVQRNAGLALAAGFVVATGLALPLLLEAVLPAVIGQYRLTCAYFLMAAEIRKERSFA
ncbi:hypothetical protein [Ciceribacter selenitireducens]|uniref:Uncharacterized protein n=1 Tax=Ciceribacter selenitireducens ATCC BAA-1503 TaxID=1336235 RepID=A0A376AKT4_9HYPH|nr:hypothetical protein [Ciceribacter selenitireducens]SSC68290.1 unnamed protein product [Ciceribacter selenitireducens ATCC BAA-1503]